MVVVVGCYIAGCCGAGLGPISKHRNQLAPKILNFSTTDGVGGILNRHILRQHNIPISPKIARQHDFGKILVESGFEKAIGSTLSAYTEAVRELACEILELIAEGLGVPDTRIFSKFIRDVDSDSVLRLNHYPPIINKDNNKDMSQQFTKVGFGEHSDPQIITILRSNEVGGLQISLQDGV
ncbi:gibberellin 2-beta-dioxygenase 4-like [Glycine soja]|uniref:gibberellin 2-beta-dioxygenase 4-like n=1 Tax=Glycine max TaxID=3847 RepID=UPI000E21C078|nr:gibberellin 2-beta-dioxygenase 4-like [Glycine max]XP_028208371.1 gibberellin 2-beta-dioxygenase 4-like [Glycine soja]|eukprot:XP_025982139.1 gibberellin 2-beta-dioxygenase 4-like [Glycine max]